MLFAVDIDYCEVCHVSVVSVSSYTQWIVFIVCFLVAPNVLGLSWAAVDKCIDTGRVLLILSIIVIYRPDIAHYSCSCYLQTRYSSLFLQINSWLRYTVIELWSLTGELCLSCARPAADGWPLVGKPSSRGQPTRPTQPFVLLELISE